MSSRLELTFHFSTDNWWRFCEEHLEELMKQISDKNKLTGAAFKPHKKCDVPWCQLKGEFEFYPQRKARASLFVPEREKINAA